LVRSATEALPDNPDLLKAMLLAERAESERLRQIIKELQRHRFGRRAETLPEEQLQLGLEDVEQIEAAGHAESEAKVPAERQERAARRRARSTTPPRQSAGCPRRCDPGQTSSPGNAVPSSPTGRRSAHIGPSQA
jgi:transposase